MITHATKDNTTAIAPVIRPVVTPKPIPNTSTHAGVAKATSAIAITRLRLWSRAPASSLSCSRSRR